MVARFSTVAGERGSPDTWRDPRGFALKFYTSEGNYDMVGNNTPVFFMRDPMKFQHFIRSQKRRADNDLRDHDMQWDFWTLSPESAHQVTWLMGDRGIPRTWRHMNGYISPHLHVGQRRGRAVLGEVPLQDRPGHRVPHPGRGRRAGRRRQRLPPARPVRARSSAANYPSWTLKVQIMPFEDAETYRFNPFDLTKVWPHGDYPLIEVGRMTLDRNPTDYHTEIEQARVRAEQPGAGHRPEPGQDAARPHVLLPRRPPGTGIGANYKQLPVNAPECAGAQLQQGRRDARTGTRPIRCTRRTPRAARRPTPRATASQPAGTPTANSSRRLHPARRGRRLGPGRHAGARGHGRRSSATGW